MGLRSVLVAVALGASSLQAQSSTSVESVCQAVIPRSDAIKALDYKLKLLHRNFDPAITRSYKFVSPLSNNELFDVRMESDAVIVNYHQEDGRTYIFVDNGKTGSVSAVGILAHPSAKKADFVDELRRVKPESLMDVSKLLPYTTEWESYVARGVIVPERDTLFFPGLGKTLQLEPGSFQSFDGVYIGAISIAAKIPSKVCFADKR